MEGWLKGVAAFSLQYRPPSPSAMARYDQLLAGLRTHEGLYAYTGPPSHTFRYSGCDGPAFVYRCGGSDGLIPAFQLNAPSSRLIPLPGGIGDTFRLAASMKEAII